MRKDLLRLSDLGNKSHLRVMQEDDGDLWVSVRDERGYVAAVEFCTIGSGGGRSPYIREALLMLYQAIEMDNETRPIE